MTAAGFDDDKNDVELLTIDEAAAFLSTSKSTLYRLIGQGLITGTKVGKQWRFKTSDLRAYLQKGSETPPPTEIGVDEEKILELVDEEPVVKVGMDIMLQALKDEASDVHIEPHKSGVRVRFRIDGVLREAFDLPKDIQTAIISRFKVLADMNVSERRVPQDGRIPVRHENREYDLRVSCVPSNFGESIAIKVLNKSNVVTRLENQGFDADELMTVRRMIGSKSGLVVVSGPMGSGRTTLLYAILNEKNHPDVKILTIEEPVEYIIPGTVQVHVVRKAGLTPSTAIAAFLNQDPDIIFAGDISEPQAAAAAIDAALRGVLVIAGLRADSVSEVLTSLQDPGAALPAIAGALKGIINRKLARQLCDACKETVSTDDARELIAKVAELSEEGGFRIPAGSTLYRSVGCEKCRKTGYDGRMALNEIFAGRPEIVEGQISAPSELQTIFADGIRKAVAGRTTIDEVIRITYGAL